MGAAARLTGSTSLRSVRLPSTPRSVQGMLALDFGQVLDPPELVEAPGTPGSDWVAVPLELRGRIEQWARRHLQAVVEVAAGDRPGAQVAHWCSPSVHRDLSRRAQLVAAGGDHAPGRRQSLATIRPLVLSVRIQMLGLDVFEASAHVRHGPRSRAVAARYQQFRGRWRAVALEFA